VRPSLHAEPGEITGTLVDVLTDLGSESSVTDARREAAEQASDEKQLKYKSVQKETKVFEGTYTPVSRRVLAIFSDDGCRVTLKVGDNTIYIFDRFGKGQHLPSMSQSFHILPVWLDADVTYEIKVEYSNTIYRGEVDIDGCTLFAFAPSLEFVSANSPHHPRESMYLMNSGLLQSIYEGSYSHGIPDCAAFKVRAWGYDEENFDVEVRKNTLGESQSVISHLVRQPASGSLLSDKPIAAYVQDSPHNEGRPLSAGGKEEFQQQGFLLLEIEPDSQGDAPIVAEIIAAQQAGVQQGTDVQADSAPDLNFKAALFNDPPVGKGEGKVAPKEINIEVDNMFDKQGTGKWRPGYDFTIEGTAYNVWGEVKFFFEHPKHDFNIQIGKISRTNDEGNQIVDVDHLENLGLDQEFSLLSNKAISAGQQGKEWFSHLPNERWIYCLGATVPINLPWGDTQPPAFTTTVDEKVAVWKMAAKQGYGSFIYSGYIYNTLKAVEKQVTGQESVDAVYLFIYFTLLHEIGHNLLGGMKGGGDIHHGWGTAGTSPNFVDVMGLGGAEGALDPIFVITNNVDRWRVRRAKLFDLFETRKYGFAERTAKAVNDNFTFLK
jgi:hypothetical protein